MTEPLRPPPPPVDLFDSDGDPPPRETEKVAPPATGTAAPVWGFKPGERIHDFVILRQLGRGSFARVYLAQQVSLDRQVALKVSDRPALGEALTLAGLEHDHIVKVYSEFADPRTNTHCLCLQYVPGTSLAAVIARLYPKGGGPPRSGRDLLEAVDALSTGEVGFDPAAAHNREVLAGLPFAEAVCRLGVQLAEALAFAHGRGVLHCDVKPANILLNRYGRPLLADFNVSVSRTRSGGSQGLGGTFDYMAPEHLSLFLQADRPATAQVDHRSDIYGLGVVLYELATGRNPFGRKASGTPEDPQARIEQRSSSPADSGIPPALERVIRRCLHPDPGQRYQSGVELAGALENAAGQMAVERRLPTGWRMTRLALRYPFHVLLGLTFFPHLIGSVVNIAYNGVEIELSRAQQNAFTTLVMTYNVVVYPACLVAAYLVVRRVQRGWERLGSPGGLSGPDLDQLRGHALGLSDWGVALACLGWFPGGLFFPLVIDALAGPIPKVVYAHFIVSFTISGLIALIYSHYGIQFVVLRVLYPRLGNPDRTDADRPRKELDRAGQWFDLFQYLATLVPLVGAVLLVALADERLTLSVRLLVASLIVLGMLGVGIAVLVRYRLNRIIGVLAGGRSESGFPSDAGRG